MALNMRIMTKELEIAKYEIENDLKNLITYLLILTKYITKKQQTQLFIQKV